jgi:hypothetical protein
MFDMYIFLWLYNLFSAIPMPCRLMMQDEIKKQQGEINVKFELLLDQGRLG